MKFQRRKGDKKFLKAQRERVRMLAINKALIYLRNVLQKSLLKERNEFVNLPKIETLKLAKNYINLLQQQLNGNNFTETQMVDMLLINLKNSTKKLLKRMIRT